MTLDTGKFILDRIFLSLLISTLILSVIYIVLPFLFQWIFVFFSFLLALLSFLIIIMHSIFRITSIFFQTLLIISQILTNELTIAVFIILITSSVLRTLCSVIILFVAGLIFPFRVILSASCAQDKVSLLSRGRISF